MLNNTAPSDIKLRLYTDNITPDRTYSMSSGLTEPGSGYSPITLTGASWSIATSTGVTTAVYAQQTFTFSGAVTIYGYFISNNAGNKMLWIESFTGGPFTLPSGGGTIQITPKITLQ